MFGWIIPDFETYINDLDSILKGLLDTITSEYMVNILIYRGNKYTMPTDLRKQFLREQRLLHAAIQYGLLVHS